MRNRVLSRAGHACREAIEEPVHDHRLGPEWLRTVRSASCVNRGSLHR